MDFTNFSLLYPDAESARRHYSGEAMPDIDMFALEELGLLEIFDLKNRELSEFTTTDPEVIKYRMDTFGDMLENESISKTLNRLIPILGDIMELRRLEADSGDANSYLTSITEIELYISSIDTLNEGLSEVRGNLHGKALTTLADRISELAGSEYYSQLNKKLSELTNRVRDIKSVTIGVNLDAQLRPTEAGVLSINPQPFRSGDVIEKILRLNFKDDEYTCIAQLVPFGKKQNENQKTALSLAFNSAINDVYKNKIAVNTVVKGNDTVKVNYVEAGRGVYSGLYIMGNDCRVDITVLTALLTEKRFTDYVAMLKNYKSGGYYSFSSHDLECYLNYRLSLIKEPKIIYIG